MDKNKKNQVSEEVIGEQPINELQQCQEKAQEYLDGWKRAQADFINYKKDEMKRIGQLVGYQIEGILHDAVEVADMFDSAFKAIPEDDTEKNKKWLEGIEYVRKQMDEVLKKNGLKRIEVAGKFDPNIHEAVDASADIQDGKIEEIRAGYMFGERVFRPARVIIKKVN